MTDRIGLERPIRQGVRQGTLPAVDPKLTKLVTEQRHRACNAMAVAGAPLERVPTS